MAQCPKCKALLEFGVTICPNCGHSATQPITQLKQFSCPYCNNIFSAESLGVEIEIQCPLCRKPIIIS